MKKIYRDAIVVGFALFSMFFGAGNLIFPSQLGFIAGTAWYKALIGFMLTGIGLPLLGIIVTIKSGGTIETLGSYIGNKVSMILGIFITIAIGPLLAMPRVAALTHEMGVLPIFPKTSPYLSSGVFFLMTLFFVLRPSKVIDHIGKWLTPVLLLTLACIIFKGIFFPFSTAKKVPGSGFFVTGALEGYQTMDALASIIFATIAIKGIEAKGYHSIEEKTKLISFSALVAGLGLVFVYGGLGYLGSLASGSYPQNWSRTEILIHIVNDIWGTAGKFALSIAVSFACLTTSIGLAATAGDFFHRISKGKLSYVLTVIAICVFSGFFAVKGVENIIIFAVPILSILYPIIIIVVVMRLFDSHIRYKSVYKGAVLGALITSLLVTLLSYWETIASTFKVSKDALSFLGIEKLISHIPFYRHGFSWLIPSLVTALFFFGFEYRREKLK